MVVPLQQEEPHKVEHQLQEAHQVVIHHKVVEVKIQ
jgi:hypothetical protein